MEWGRQSGEDKGGVGEMMGGSHASANRELILASLMDFIIFLLAISFYIPAKS
jgi:hypothetical protein